MTLAQTTGDKTRYSVVAGHGFTLRIVKFLGRYKNATTGEIEYALCLGLGYSTGFICLPASTKVEMN